tara:strand:- start:43 stop:204 length:162 start_codon:yes stop_codon:yes gene_type:complete
MAIESLRFWGVDVRIESDGFLTPARAKKGAPANARRETSTILEEGIPNLAVYA